MDLWIEERTARQTGILPSSPAGPIEPGFPNNNFNTITTGFRKTTLPTLNYLYKSLHFDKYLLTTKCLWLK